VKKIFSVLLLMCVLCGACDRNLLLASKGTPEEAEVGIVGIGLKVLSGAMRGAVSGARGASIPQKKAVRFVTGKNDYGVKLRAFQGLGIITGAVVGVMVFPGAINGAVAGISSINGAREGMKSGFLLKATGEALWQWLNDLIYMRISSDLVSEVVTGAINGAMTGAMAGAMNGAIIGAGAVIGKQLS
jgi:hypothetical protein